MKAVFMGTPEIAVPTLKAMAEAGIDVTLVVSQPDRQKGRGRKLQPTPVKQAAEELGIEVYQPEKIRGNHDAYEKLKAQNADFFVVVAYGQILPEEVLNIPKFAPINVHFSLLPKYRGAAPVNWAVINGEETTGVTTMIMGVGLDTGDMLLKSETAIDKKSTVDLAEELSATGAELLVKTLKNFSDITPEPQKDDDSSYAPLMKKTDGLIDWTRPADEIERRIRGFAPWPAAFSSLNGKSVKIYGADVDSASSGRDAAEVFDVTRKSFKVACGEGALIIKDIQLEGKKRMDTASFLAGCKLENGEKLGT